MSFGETALGSPSVQAVRRTPVTVASSAATAHSTSGDTGPLAVGVYTDLAVDILLSALLGTVLSITFYVDRQDALGQWFNLVSSVAIVSLANPQPISWSIGAGMSTNQSVAGTVRLRWVLGTLTTSSTFSYSIIGK